MLELQTNLEQQRLLDEWPADPRARMVLADELDALAVTANGDAAVLRQRAVELRDSAWRQMGA